MDIWAEGLRNGNNKSYEVLFNKYWRRLLFYAENVVRDAEAAEDIVQDAFGQIFKCRKEIESDKHANNFLYLHVKRKCLSFLKKKRIEEEKVTGLCVQQAIEENATDIDYSYVYAQIIEIIAELPKRQQRAIMNRAVTGNRTSTIKENSEYLLICRAKKAIKKKLSERNYNK